MKASNNCPVSIGVRTLSMIALCLGFGWVATPTLAHPGGLNSEGCHNNRKTGDYHCHRKSSPRGGEGSEDKPSKPSRGSFANCTEARAAGAAPVRAGDPGYGRHPDRDSDGIGCE